MDQIELAVQLGRRRLDGIPLPEVDVGGHPLLARALADVDIKAVEADRVNIQLAVQLRQPDPVFGIPSTRKFSPIIALIFGGDRP